ncbi:MAG TPA: septum site-determining protein MinC [Kofleriaceae bacterium]|nr:septum site-determining protein MinC [Kofleriaceae bacterium]
MVALKGTTRGLEIQIAGAATADALGARLRELLAEAPGFFAGSDARVVFEGALPAGALSCLERVASEFALHLIEIAPASQKPRSYAAIVRQVDEVRGKLAEGSGPIADAAPAAPIADDAAAEVIELIADSAPVAMVEAELANAVSIGNAAPSRDDEILALAEQLASEMAAEMAAKQAGELADKLADELATIRAAELAKELAKDLAKDLARDLAKDLAEDLAAKRAVELAEDLSDLKARALVAALPPGPKFVIGPVRSGVIVDHTGHVVVVGDVNPGAEVRAEGSIIVLGRLRGVAHAAIGREAGCIVALSLAPQQLRIGRSVARAGANDRPSDRAEIAYLTGETIVVERFTGRLPSGLAASM